MRNPSIQRWLRNFDYGKWIRWIFAVMLTVAFVNVMVKEKLVGKSSTTLVRRCLNLAVKSKPGLEIKSIARLIRCLYVEFWNKKLAFPMASGILVNSVTSVSTGTSFGEPMTAEHEKEKLENFVNDMHEVFLDSPNIKAIVVKMLRELNGRINEDETLKPNINVEICDLPDVSLIQISICSQVKENDCKSVNYTLTKAPLCMDKIPSNDEVAGPVEFPNDKCENGKMEPCVDGGNNNSSSSGNGQPSSEWIQAQSNRNYVPLGNACQDPAKLPLNGDDGGDENEPPRGCKRIGGCLNSDIANCSRKKRRMSDLCFSIENHNASLQINADDEEQILCRQADELLDTAVQSEPVDTVPTCLSSPNGSHLLIHDCPQFIGVDCNTSEEDVEEEQLDHGNEGPNQQIQLLETLISAHPQSGRSSRDFIPVDGPLCRLNDNNGVTVRGYLSKQQGQDSDSDHDSHNGTWPLEPLFVDTGQGDAVPSDSLHTVGKLALPDRSLIHTGLSHANDQDLSPQQPTQEASIRSDGSYTAPPSAGEGDTRDSTASNGLQGGSNVEPTVLSPPDTSPQDLPYEQPAAGVDDQSNRILENDQGIFQQSQMSNLREYAIHEVNTSTRREVQATRRNRTFDHPAGVYDRITWQCHGCPVQHVSERFSMLDCNDCGRHFCLDCTDRHPCLRTFLHVEYSRRNRTFDDPPGNYGRRLWSCFSCDTLHMSSRFVLHYCPYCGREFCLDCSDGHCCMMYWF